MKLSIGWLKENGLTILAIALMLYVIYEIVNTLLGHSLDLVTLAVSSLISLNLFMLNELKDLGKENALGFMKISHKLDEVIENL